MMTMRLMTLTLAVFAVVGLDAQAASDSGSGSGSEVIECPAIGCAAENAYNPLCGTNNVTYDNACELEIAGLCSGKKNKIVLAYEGNCTADGKPAPNGTDEATPPTAPQVPAPAGASTPAPTMSGASALFAVGTTAMVALAAAALA